MKTNNVYHKLLLHDCRQATNQFFQAKPSLVNRFLKLWVNSTSEEKSRISILKFILHKTKLKCYEVNKVIAHVIYTSIGIYI